jgi:PEP-CTERM motif
VPEPASWAMLIAGFGLVGLVSRRAKRATVVAA